MTSINKFSERAIEPVSTCLVRMLMVPDVYIEAPWAGGRADVLAIDRAGRGDVHVVEIESSGIAAFDAIPRLMAIPSHFRWLAFPYDTPVPFHRVQELDAGSGPGRIGLIEVFPMADGRLAARATSPAERTLFSLHDEIAALQGGALPFKSFRKFLD